MNDFRNQAITQSRICLSRYRRVIPAIIKKQVFKQWDQAEANDQSFTVADAKDVISERCGDCCLKGFPKVSVESGTICLHVASNNRRKMIAA